MMQKMKKRDIERTYNLKSNFLFYELDMSDFCFVGHDRFDISLQKMEVVNKSRA